MIALQNAGVGILGSSPQLPSLKSRPLFIDNIPGYHGYHLHKLFLFPSYVSPSSLGTRPQFPSIGWVEAYIDLISYHTISSATHDKPMPPSIIYVAPLLESFTP